MAPGKADPWISKLALVNARGLPGCLVEVRHVLNWLIAVGLGDLDFKMMLVGT